MKKFLAIYIGTAAATERSQWNTMDEAQRKKLQASGMKAWGDWMTAHKAAVVEQGGPLGKRNARLHRELRIPRTA